MLLFLNIPYFQVETERKRATEKEMTLEAVFAKHFRSRSSVSAWNLVQRDIFRVR